MLCWRKDTDEWRGKGGGGEVVEDEWRGKGGDGEVVEDEDERRYL